MTGCFMKFINIGFNNLVSAERIIAVSSPDPAPMRRIVQDGKEAGRVIDCSAGKKTKSVIITDSGHIILSAISPEALEERLNESSDGQTDKNNI